MEKIVIKSTGFDIEQHIDAVASYVRENGYPRFSYQPIDFHWIEGECLICGWMISEIKDKHLLDIFRCQYGWSKTNGGIAYDPGRWNQSTFEVDGHYYFMDK